MSNQLQEDLAARIAGLKPDARRAVYERARAALQAEVRASAPFMPVQTVVARRRELEKAILAVEREAERHDPPPPIAKPAPAPTPSAPLAEQKSARKPNDAPERTKASVVAPAQTQEPRSSPEWIPEAHGYEPVMTDRTTGGPNTLAQFADAMPPRGAGDPPSAAEPRADENKRGRQAPREHAVEGSADAGVQVSPLEHQDEDVVEEGYEEAFVEPPSRPRGAVYAGIVALTLCAAALAVVLVGFTSDVRPHAPREAAHLAAPMPLPSPSSSGARLIDSAGFQDAARDALREGETLLAQRDFAGAVAALDDTNGTHAVGRSDSADDLATYTPR